MEELQEMDVTLVLVSIGKPEIANALVKHLQIPHGEKYLFVDPTNTLYDALHLNRGLKETFFSPSTPLSFLDRFSKPDGMVDLINVLSKWNKGTSCLEIIYNAKEIKTVLSWFLCGTDTSRIYIHRVV
jgi:hypothetical protein